MTWRLEWSPRAIKDAERLDRAVRERIVRALDRYAEGEQGDVKQLVGQGGVLRLRVGDYRVFFERRHRVRILHILRVRHRREAYRSQ